MCLLGTKSETHCLYAFSFPFGVGFGAFALYVFFTTVAIATLARSHTDCTRVFEAFAFALGILGASLSHGDSNESEEDDNDGKREPHFVDLNASFSDVGNVGASECRGLLWGTGPGSQTLIT